MSETPRLVVGVDVGGTFTDVFALDEASGRVGVGKVFSTRGDQSVGFLEGIGAQAPDFARIATIVHGTTVGTNALLERKVARTGVITTRGFRDVLEMRRRDRPQTWGLWGTFEPLVPRDLRVEVGERTLAEGTVRERVDPAEVAAAARTLLERGAEAACVFFVNSYANDANERAAVEVVRSLWPSAHVTASAEILPEIREFERASTASLNAALQPVVGHYLERLEQALAAQGFRGQLLIVQSNGGVMAAQTARRFPVRTALSGPAAGVIACAHLARATGIDDVITCDMGGTSFDVSLVTGGESALAAQTSIDFGLTIRSPMIEITTLGAGGGSLARVDASGMLDIGPESAGSDPGPVCYGLGNTRPTVTDANAVLGRINAERPIGGRLARLDVDAAREAILRHVGEPLGLDALAAAEAIVRVANSKMAGALRLVSIERGHDPQRFALLPFGGGGALHVCALMRETGCTRALVPRFPGVTSALGCVIADMRHDFVQTLNANLDALDLAALRDLIERRRAEGEGLLRAAGVEFARVVARLELDMLYVGQTHTVAVPLGEVSGDGAPLRADAIRAAFDARYRALFGQLLEAVPVRVLNARLAVTGERRKFDLALLAPPADATLEAARIGRRTVWFGAAQHDARVYARLALPAGATVEGPALLEQPDTTIWLEPGMSARVDRFGNLLIHAA